MSRTTRTDRSASWKTIVGRAWSPRSASASTSWSLWRYLISCSKSCFLAPWAAVRMIAPPSPSSRPLDCLRSRSRSLSSSRRETPMPSPCGHVDEVAAGDRELHRQARALRLERVLDRLDEDLLAGLEQLGDPLALAAGAAAASDLDAGDDHVIGVQEAVLLEADVDERGLEAGQDVVDLALVDVPDDRAGAATLYVELADPPLRFLLTAFALSGGRALRLEDGDTRFATVGRDEYLLSQISLS